jgi:hypothetical protein
VETTHLVLLLVMLGMAGCILACLVLLVLRGTVAARSIGSGSADAEIGTLANFFSDAINWHEINALPSPTPAQEDRAATSWRDQARGLFAPLYQRFLRWPAWRRFSGLQTQSSFPAVRQETLADPVDGTQFKTGEKILRCACGTGYHTHSWQWIGENNGGRCVTCKQVACLAS